jgi:hypothetical protein
MRLLPGAVLLGTILALPAVSMPAGSDECVATGVASSRCLYRSLLPSSGIVADCRNDRDCRVGYYYGDPGAPVWFEPPAALGTLPKPEVAWPTATLAQVRFDCGHGCSVSYFFEAKRRRLSDPRWFVLAVDPRRLLLAAAEDHALVVRQVFSGREVTRIKRDWAPAAWLGDAVVAIHFDADARLSFTWLRGADRVPVSERLSIPSFARS